MNPIFFNRYSAFLFSEMLEMSNPSKIIWPSKSKRPAIALKKVVLPHPLGPYITTRPYLGNVIEIFFRTFCLL